MSEQGVLQARTRDKTGTLASRRLRREGKVPVVLYGLNVGTQHLWVPHRDLRQEISRGQRIFSLEVDGSGSIMTVLKEVQMDVYQENIIHADFQKIDATKEIEVHVPVELHGTPAGEKDGGRLDQPLRTLTIHCLPSAIPEKLLLDVSELKIGDTLNISRIVLPEGVKVKEDPGLVVCSLQPPKLEEAAAAPAPEEMKEPELIGRKKEDEEEEEGGEKEKDKEKEKKEKKDKDKEK